MVNVIDNSDWRLLGKCLLSALLSFTIWAVAFRSTNTVLVLVLAVVILAILHFADGYLTSNSSV